MTPEATKRAVVDAINLLPDNRVYLCEAIGVSVAQFYVWGQDVRSGKKRSTPPSGEQVARTLELLQAHIDRVKLAAQELEAVEQQQAAA